jgi:hypothetical protein
VVTLVSPAGGSGTVQPSNSAGVVVPLAGASPVQLTDTMPEVDPPPFDLL